MYFIPKLNEKLAGGQMLLGSHVGFDSPFVTEMLGGCGFDFLWIDGEHCAMDKKDIQLHLLACRAAGVAGIVRVPWNDFVFMKAIMDMGADGIIVPYVRSLEEAQAAVAAMTYPPEGIRGMGLRRAVNYGLWDKAEYLADPRSKLWTLIQVEHIDIVKDLEQIAQLPGVAGFIVGPNDFAMSMAQDGRACTGTDPQVQRQFDRIGQILSRYPHKVFGVSGVYSPAFVEAWTRRGANLMSMNFDFHYIVQGGKAVHDGAREVLARLGRP